MKIACFNPVQNLDRERKMFIQISKDQFQVYSGVIVLALLLKLILKKKVAHLNTFQNTS